MKIKTFPVKQSALSLALAVMLTGCVGYRLGSMLPPDINSVYVPTVVNRTGEPLLEDEVTRAVITQIQRDGSLRIAGAEDADAVLNVTIKDFTLNPIAYDRHVSSRADEYRMILTASIIFSRRSDGKVLVEAPRLSGESTFIFSSDLSQAKRDALPEAARDLAHDIVERIVEMW